MNHDYSCLDCAMSAMSSSVALGEPRINMPAIPKMVDGVCPVCGSNETVDLTETNR